MDSECRAAGPVEPARVALHCPALSLQRVAGEIDAVEGLGSARIHTAARHAHIRQRADNQLGRRVVDGQNAIEVALARRQHPVGESGVVASTQHNLRIVAHHNVARSGRTRVAVGGRATLLKMTSFQLHQTVVHALVDVILGGDDQSFRFCTAHIVAIQVHGLT